MVGWWSAARFYKATLKDVDIWSGSISKVRFCLCTPTRLEVCSELFLDKTKNRYQTSDLLFLSFHNELFFDISCCVSSMSHYNSRMIGDTLVGKASVRTHAIPPALPWPSSTEKTTLSVGIKCRHPSMSPCRTIRRIIIPWFFGTRSYPIPN